MKLESLIHSLLPRLLEALRRELGEYGEMLSLLENQREQVLSRNGMNVIQTVTAIQQQAEKIESARSAREASQQQIATTLTKPRGASMALILPLLPENQRFALAALVRENNDLMTRVQQRMRQNHLLLSRSLDLMQRFMNTLLPSPIPAT
ncbi:MAG TPA: flagellar export chaperone FlgN [Candidatus Saccharimonadales bacterium]|nr:flagellar export chaperone FlgN [Candidatus Saccharimonadales bacterium]